jgi:hypothetical protein
MQACYERGIDNRYTQNSQEDHILTQDHFISLPNIHISFFIASRLYVTSFEQLNKIIANYTMLIYCPMYTVI